MLWGTTYLGIRIALDSFPPALLVCLRTLISGGITITVAAMIGAHLPRGRDLWITAGYGLMVIAVGNGTLAVVEQWIPTGLSSLFVTTAPFWFVGIDAFLKGGERLHGPTIRGLLLGFVGVLLLVAPDAWAALTQHSFSSGGSVVLAFLLLQVSGASWALGSLLQRNRRSQMHPFVIGRRTAAQHRAGIAGAEHFPIAVGALVAARNGSDRVPGDLRRHPRVWLLRTGDQPAAARDCVDLHLHQSSGGGLSRLVGVSGALRPARGGRHGGYFRGRGDGAAGELQCRLKIFAPTAPPRAVNSV